MAVRAAGDAMVGAAAMNPMLERLTTVLSRRGARRAAVSGATPSAVLLALREGERGLELLFLKRPASMRHHAGQHAFPGGRSEAGDADAVATALREAHEEVGLAPESVRVLGQLDELRTLSSDFVIAPVVGVVPAGVALSPCADEVDELAWLPLEPFTHGWSVLPLRGEGFTRLAMAYRIQGRVIWGATARMARQLGALAMS